MTDEAPAKPHEDTAPPLPPGRPPTGASLEQAQRTLRRNSALVRGDAVATEIGEEEIAGRHTESQEGGDPGITRGDYSND
jgi:hypothetical protein